MARPMREADWDRMAREHLGAARMLEHRFPAFAYYHAGYAVEFALKCRIMRREGLRRWPPRNQRPELHSHDLSALGVMAGVEADLRRPGQGSAGLDNAWSKATRWSVAVRYESEPFPRRRAADILGAVETSGLLEWLLR